MASSRKPSTPRLEPEAGDAEQRLDDLGIVQVEVRLLLQEVVQVILAATRLPLPGDAAEDREPVVGRAAVAPGVGPDVPVGLRVVPRLAALQEPAMLVAGVARHEVDQDPQAQAVGLLEHPVEVVERAEDRVDVAVVGDVVAIVLHRALEEGRDPDRVHAQRGHVVEPLNDAREVADAVAVGIAEAARVDLVDHRTPPPVVPARADLGQVVAHEQGLRPAGGGPCRLRGHALNPSRHRR